jgi:hypothetical protein
MRVRVYMCVFCNGVLQVWKYPHLKTYGLFLKALNFLINNSGQEPYSSQERHFWKAVKCGLARCGGLDLCFCSSQYRRNPNRAAGMNRGQRPTSSLLARFHLPEARNVEWAVPLRFIPENAEHKQEAPGNHVNNSFCSLQAQQRFQTPLALTFSDYFLKQH